MKHWLLIGLLGLGIASQAHAAGMTERRAVAYMLAEYGDEVPEGARDGEHVRAAELACDATMDVVDDLRDEACEVLR